VAPVDGQPSGEQSHEGTDDYLEHLLANYVDHSPPMVSQLVVRMPSTAPSPRGESVIR